LVIIISVVKVPVLRPQPLQRTSRATVTLEQDDEENDNEQDGY
jgi:hypothetical protein